MEGAKALALDAFAERQGLAMLRFDYSGTGSSSGDFEDGTLDRWIDESLALIDGLTEGPLILVGSSMGGWIALHVALRRTERVAALVGIAAAPDFTEWGFTAEQKAELMASGRIEEPNPSRTGASDRDPGLLGLSDSGCLLGTEIAVDLPSPAGPRRATMKTSRSTSRSGPCGGSVQPMSSC